MSNFLISLRIHSDGYEKVIPHLITDVACEDDACYQALVNETHNTPLTREEYDNHEEWEDDCMIYRVCDVKGVSPEQVSVLKQFIY